MTTKPIDRWKTPQVKDLSKALLKLKTPNEVTDFLRDLLTVKEIETFAQRWQVARLLDEGESFKVIQQKSGASSATIARVNQWLQHGMSGYRAVLDRLKQK